MTTATSHITSTPRPTGAPDPAERLAYLTLALIPGLGARRLAALLSQFGSATSILDASLAELLSVAGMSRAAASAILRPPRAEAARLAEHAVARGQQALVPCDPGYPSALRSIPDPPVVLFAVGDVALFERPAVAIVGSREHSRYGAEIAALLARTAAEAGIPVVSGMARGLDAVAQAAALDAGGASVGVLGSGADVVYPVENRALFRRMRDGGLLLTEHPPGERPSRGAFPRRNRLISGLAKVLVVIEAAEASGTLVTVSCALEQGREVLVVPGPINSVTSQGTNRLLRDGATPLLAPADLLAAFGATPAATPAVAFQPPHCTLAPHEAGVLAVLCAEARHIDEVALAAGLPVGLVLGTLLGLELGGLVEQLPGDRYRRR